MPKFIIYTRCSTEEQGKTGTSHTYQVDGIRRSGAVKVAGCVEVGCFQDTTTGTRFDNRSGLDTALKLCAATQGGIDYLYIYRWDRLGRDVADCFHAIRKFEATGTEVNCPDEWIDFADPSWPLLLAVKFGMAQSESMRISDRTRDGIYARLCAGYWPHLPPVGYTKKETGKTHTGQPLKVCVPDPGKWELVKTCFEKFARAEAGKVELWREYGNRLGVSKNQIARMLHNPFYLGLIPVPAYRKEPARLTEGKHEPMVSRAIWDGCQAVAAATENGNKGKTWTASDTGEVFWLKGVLYCPKTDTRHTAYSAKSHTGKRYGYYSNPKAKGAQIIRADEAHGVVTRAMQEFTLLPETYSKIMGEAERQVAEQFAAANLEAAKCRKQIEVAAKRLESVRVKFADEEITPGEFRDMKTLFEAEKIAAQSRLLQHEKELEAVDDLTIKVCQLLRDIGPIFASAQPTDKTAILRAFFPKGFSVQNGKVRTPEINFVVAGMFSLSMSYVEVLEEKGPGFDARPFEGGTAGRR